MVWAIESFFGSENFMPPTALASFALSYALIYAFGKRRGRIAGLSDSSQLVTLHEKLRAAYDELDKLRQSNAELERFAYVASHDMQEPVRMVMNFSHIIAHDYGDRLDETGKEYVNFITGAAERIHNMIEDLLDYARIDGEEQAAVLVDGATEIDHALANLDALIKERGARVTCERLPRFYGNPIQFMRLMQNLIANAIKYQKPGNTPVIHVAAKDQGSTWHISVQDNGLGIDENFTDRIFEPFRRLHSWEDIKGTGLGLAVCKKIAENHGGKIWVKSVPKQGSTFFVSLPKSRDEQESAA